MTTQVQTRETRTVIFVNGVQTYRITVQCMDRGELPDTHLFLKQIVDDDDPQQDIFVRIVALADLDALNTDPDEPGYKASRDGAIGNNQLYWRSDSFTKDYTDIETADAAREAISDRLNTLTSDFETYDSAFKTDPTQDLYYPSASATTITTLQEAYATAYTAYETAETDLTAKQTALTTAESGLTNAESALSDWTTFQSDMQALIDNASAVAGAFSSFASTYAKTFMSCVDKFTEDYTDHFPRYQEMVLEIQLASSPWQDFDDDDVGATVTDSSYGGTSYGTLIAYDNDNRTILVNPDEPEEDNMFDAANNIEVSGHVGVYWTMSSPATVEVDAGEGPNLQELIACRNRFAQYRLTAETDVSNANSGNTKAQAIKADVDTQVITKTTLVTQARTAVTSAQEDYNKAQADLQTAYDNLETAYDAVKTVCPSWSPDDPFPPLP